MDLGTSLVLFPLFQYNTQVSPSGQELWPSCRMCPAESQDDPGQFLQSAAVAEDALPGFCPSWSSWSMFSDFGKLCCEGQIIAAWGGTTLRHSFYPTSMATTTVKIPPLSQLTPKAVWGILYKQMKEKERAQAWVIDVSAQCDLERLWQRNFLPMGRPSGWIPCHPPWVERKVVNSLDGIQGLEGKGLGLGLTRPG
jgi:hypothetical protein